MQCRETHAIAFHSPCCAKLCCPQLATLAKLAAGSVDQALLSTDQAGNGSGPAQGLAELTIEDFRHAGGGGGVILLFCYVGFFRRS